MTSIKGQQKLTQGIEKGQSFMTHALRNYSRVSTRLWNNFFWNNFQGIIFEGGRYTIMHVGI